jgi:RecG-like helicase
VARAWLADVSLPHRPGSAWWAAPLTELPGAGPATARRAAGIGINDIGDLAEHLPSRYLSYDSARPVSALADGEEATIRVTLDSIAVVPTRRRGGRGAGAGECGEGRGPPRRPRAVRQ